VALSNAVLPYALKLANQGLAAFANDPGFAKALNTYRGNLTLRTVAEDLSLQDRYRPYIPAI
jgi:alanine dehydrogenase